MPTEPEVDPFRFLVEQRAASAARSTSLDTAATVLTRYARVCGAVRFGSRRSADDAVSTAVESLYRLAERVHDGLAAPPERWKAYVDTSIRHAWISAERRYGLGYELPAVVPADVDVALESESRAAERDIIRAVRRLQGAVEAGVVPCIHHPGRRCQHLTTGRRPAPCMHRSAVFDVLGRTVALGSDEPMTRQLAALTGYDPRRDGHELERHVYRCARWFTYLTLRSLASAADFERDLARMENRLFDDLRSTGRDAPSATTVCLLMSDFPGVPVPVRLRREHIDHTNRQGSTR